MNTKALGLVLLALACGGEPAANADSPGHASSTARLSGMIRIDGSSTVFPITEAVAEEFGAIQPRVRVTVGVSGTGGGFKKFGAGETAIADASRLIKSKEIELCESNGIEFIELPVAYDGIAIVVNKSNEFCKDMTVAELEAMWSANSSAHTWADIRQGWPDREFRLYAPGQDSGTFDYFTDEINGESGNCRADATFSEDDNVLVRGVAGDRDGIGFFGFAYYLENKDALNVVRVDGGNGPVEPDLSTIASGRYSPLSRPLFIYVSKAAAERPEIEAFVDFYLSESEELVREVGYVPLPASDRAGVVANWKARRTGTHHSASHG